MRLNPLCSEFDRAVVDAADPLMAETRKAVLNWYEENLRENYGETLQGIINTIQGKLDEYMPAE